MVDQGKEDGTIQEDEKEYINNVFEFNLIYFQFEIEFSYHVTILK